MSAIGPVCRPLMKLANRHLPVLLTRVHSSLATKQKRFLFVSNTEFRCALQWSLAQQYWRYISRWAGLNKNTPQQVSGGSVRVITSGLTRRLKLQVQTLLPTILRDRDISLHTLLNTYYIGFVEIGLLAHIHALLTFRLSAYSWHTLPQPLIYELLHMCLLQLHFIYRDVAYTFCEL